MTLMDSLGVLIAFTTVMLLLSLVVTAVVQAASQLFGLRARNLEVGVRLALQHVLRLPSDTAKEYARLAVQQPQILQSCGAESPAGQTSSAGGSSSAAGGSDSSSGGGTSSTSGSSSSANGSLPTTTKLFVKLRTPALTWIEPENLPRLLSKSCHITIGNDQQKELTDAFNRLDAYLTGRFAYHMRLCSIVTAMLVAFGFQVSAPDLLNQLSTNTAFRDSVVSLATDAAQQAKETVENGPLDKEIPKQALATIIQNHPDLASVLQNVDTSGDTIANQVEALGSSLSGEPDEKKQAVLQEYEAELKQLQEDAILKRAKSALHTLAEINISWWPQGGSFYRDYRNWIGVIVTGILLTLGAPFWFKLLAEMLKLKDVLGGAEGKKP